MNEDATAGGAGVSYVEWCSRETIGYHRLSVLKHSTRRAIVGKLCYMIAPSSSRKEWKHNTNNIPTEVCVRAVRTVQRRAELLILQTLCTAQSPHNQTTLFSVLASI